MQGRAKLSYQVKPIGVVRREEERATLQLHRSMLPALLGLEGFSHVWVLYWFHENDTHTSRSILQVHPRKDPENPLTGVFGTRSPVRPNLIGLCLCKILHIDEKRGEISVTGLDARDGTPLLDLKPYLPHSDRTDELKLPAWAANPHI